MTIIFTKAKELLEKDHYHQQAGSIQHLENSLKEKRNFSNFFKGKTKK